MKKKLCSLRKGLCSACYSIQLRDFDRKTCRDKYREYRSKNKSKINARSRLWFKANRIKNGEDMRRKQREMYRINLNYRIASILRSRVYVSLKKKLENPSSKAGSAVANLGCSVDYFIKYLERKFKKGMSWSNYGNRDRQWSIDHIKPMAWFDLTKESHIKQACNYKNMRPEWHKDNISKRDRYMVSPGDKAKFFAK